MASTEVSTESSTSIEDPSFDPTSHDDQETSTHSGEDAEEIAEDIAQDIPSTSCNYQETSTQSGKDAKDISFRYRGQPSVIHDLYTEMSADQISDMMQTEYRGALNVGMNCTLPHGLVVWLIRRVDTKAKKLTLGKDDKKVEIDLTEAAAKVFLLRNEGKTVPIDPFAAGRISGRRQDIGSESPGNHGRKGQMRLRQYFMKMKTCRNSRKATYRIFKNAIFSSLFVPNSSQNVERRLRRMLKNDEDWNWPEFIVNYLVKSIENVLHGGSYLVGCPLLLVVIFLDMISHEQLDEIGVPEGFPRVQHLTKVHLDWLKKQDFDSLNIKDLSESVYSEDVPLNMEKMHLTFDDDDLDDGDTSEEDVKEAPLSHQAAQSNRLMIEKLKETLDSISGKDTVEDMKTKMTELHAEYSAKLNNVSGMPSDSNEKDGILQDLLSGQLEIATSYVQSHKANMQALVNQWIQCMENASGLNKATRAYIEQGLPKRERKRRFSEMEKHGRPRRSAEKIIIDDTPEGTNQGSFQQQFQYPAVDHYNDRGKLQTLPLRCKDLECLTNNGTVTDTILELYCLHLSGDLPLLPIIPDGISHKYYINSTFLWMKIDECRHYKEYRKLASWFKDVKISDLKFLFVPMGGNLHWSLVTFYWPRDDDTGSDKCYILHMDSMERYHDSARMFQKAKLFAKHALRITAEIIPVKIGVPDQGPTLDCALFTLYSMQKLILAINDFKVENCDQDYEHWYEPSDAAALRGEIKKLIEKNKLKVVSDECKYCSASAHAALMKEFEGCMTS